MNKLFAFFFLILCSVAAAYGGTYTAATCSYTDVNDCINHSGVGTCSPGGTHTAVNGDVIIIPTGSCIWANQLTVNRS